MDSLGFTADHAPLLEVECLLTFHANAGSRGDLFPRVNWLGHQWRGWHALW